MEIICTSMAVVSYTPQPLFSVQPLFVKNKCGNSHVIPLLCIGFTADSRSQCKNYTNMSAPCPYNEDIRNSDAILHTSIVQGSVDPFNVAFLLLVPSTASSSPYVI
jgi:hypothetical protein